MKKSALEMHLEKITEGELIAHKNECMSLFARCNGVKLGIDGYGNFCVEKNSERYSYQQPNFAIEKYTKLIFES
jgi:hypothetical protein